MFWTLGPEKFIQWEPEKQSKNQVVLIERFNHVKILIESNTTRQVFGHILYNSSELASEKSQFFKLCVSQRLIISIRKNNMVSSSPKETDYQKITSCLILKRQVLDVLGFFKTHDVQMENLFCISFWRGQTTKFEILNSKTQVVPFFWDQTFRWCQISNWKLFNMTDFGSKFFYNLSNFASKAS